jgi:hypothetical protein
LARNLIFYSYGSRGQIFDRFLNFSNHRRWSTPIVILGMANNFSGLGLSPIFIASICLVVEKLKVVVKNAA